MTERRKVSVGGLEIREADKVHPRALVVCCPNIILLDCNEVRLLAELLTAYADTGRLPEVQADA